MTTPNKDSKNIIIIGCGRVGIELALSLDHHHAVTVIDPNHRAFERLNADFHGRTVQGEGMDIDILRRAGIETAYALAAATTSDSTNFVAARIARDMYKVPNVVARVYNPRRAPLYAKFGLTVVTSSSWGAQRMGELLFPLELRSVYDVGNGVVQCYELSVPASWNGRTLHEVLPTEGVLPVSLLRSGNPSLPSAKTTLNTQDVLTVSATTEGITQLQKQLGKH